MPSIHQIRTPALLLDRRILARNLEAMSRRMTDHAVVLRPHMKTAKSDVIASLATQGQPGGITVSTLRETAYFVERGFTDITYAVGISPRKLDDVAALQARGATVRILTDDLPVARRIADADTSGGTPFRVLIEIDTGAHRGGVGPDDPVLLEIARVLADGPGSRLDGVLTHAGHSYECAGVEEIRDVAEQERAGVVRAAERLREAGYDCPVVSAGSTPTAVHATSFEGITEMRPGNYMFFDLFQEGLGTCRRAEIAISVLTSVIGRTPGSGRCLVDAGALALSSDTSAGRWSGEIGYGTVIDLSGGVPPGKPWVVRVHQEHGFVETSERFALDTLSVGDRLRILPNHACATAAMHDRYHVTDGGGGIVETWERVRGW